MHRHVNRGARRIGTACCVVLAGLTVGWAAEQPPSSIPGYLVTLGDEVVFAAQDPIHGRELWRYTRSGQCELIADLAYGSVGSSPRDLRAIPGAVLFVASTPLLGTELFVYRAGSMKVELLKDFCPGNCSGDPMIIAADPPSTAPCYVTGIPATNTVSLYALDPESLALRPVALPTRILPRTFYCYDGDDLYIDVAGSLWMVAPGAPESVPIWEGRHEQLEMLILASLGGRIVFSGYSTEAGRELWVYDSLTAQSSLLCDINPGPVSSHMINVLQWRDIVLFGARSRTAGLELWRTDSTPEGTYLLADINAGAADSDPHYFTDLGGTVFFVADDGSHGKELWRTDGTRDGTSLVLDLWPGTAGSEPWSLTDFDGALYFAANSPIHGEELFRSDGTEGGTGLVADIAPHRGNSGPDNLTVLGDRLLFTARDARHGEELWSTRGSATDTELVRDIWTAAAPLSSYPRHLTGSSGKLYFVVNDAQHVPQLWVSDGTTEGTVSLGASISHASDAGEPIVVYHSKVYFAGTDPEHGDELWTTDGTSTGTRLVRDIFQGPASAAPREFSEWNGLLVFVADDPQRRGQLWATAGSEETTRPLLESGTAPVDRLAPGPERLYFTAGSLAGTHMLRALEFPADGYPCGADRLTRFGVLTLPSKGPRDFRETIRTWNTAGELSSTDVLSGCIPLCLLANRSSNFAMMGERMYLTGYSPETGYELCVTDGTVDGSRVVADLYPGPASAAPSAFGVRGDCLYFIAEHPREGRVLWEYNSTSESVRVLMPLLGNFPTTVRARSAVVSGTSIYFSGPHPMEDDLANATLGAVELAGSNADTIAPIRGFDTGEARWPHGLVPVGDDLYFVADDGIHGQELWKTQLPDHTSFLVKDILVQK